MLLDQMAGLYYYQAGTEWLEALHAEYIFAGTVVGKRLGFKSPGVLFNQGPPGFGVFLGASSGVSRDGASMAPLPRKPGLLSRTW